MTARPVVAMLLAVIPAAAQQQQQLASVRGTVVNASSGEGLRKAFVRLWSRSNSYPVQTDDQGAFAIDGIEPGSYSLFAERQGFVETSEDESQRITLTPGQALTGVKVKLSPQASISGRVLDEDGEVWTHAVMGLSRLVWRDGRRQIEPIDGGPVNDLGEFRLAELRPGSYFVDAQPDRNWEIEHTPRTKEPAAMRLDTWYPSSLDSARATPIVLRPGDQLSGIQIRLRRDSVHRIRGTVMGLGAIPSPSTENPFTGRGIDADGLPGNLRPDGSFEISNLPPGSYEVRVRQDYPRLVLGGVQVQIADRDIEDLSIPLTPPQALKGALQVSEGTGRGSGVKVVLERAYAYEDTAIAAADGTFEFPKLGIGTYRVTVESGSGAYLKQIRLGDKVSTDGSILLTGADGPLVLTLSTKGARLAGLVTKLDENSAAQIVLAPSDPSLGKIRIAKLDQNSVYSFDEMLPPGTYKLFAFEGVPDGIWEDPDFMKEVAAKGTDVKLGEADSQRVDVPVIKKTELASTLQKLGVE